MFILYTSIKIAGTLNTIKFLISLMFVCLGSSTTKLAVSICFYFFLSFASLYRLFAYFSQKAHQLQIKIILHFKKGILRLFR